MQRLVALARLAFYLTLLVVLLALGRQFNAISRTPERDRLYYEQRLKEHQQFVDEHAWRTTEGPYGPTKIQRPHAVTGGDPRSAPPVDRGPGSDAHQVEAGPGGGACHHANGLPGLAGLLRQTRSQVRRGPRSGYLKQQWRQRPELPDAIA